jgi:uncharacterized protein (DUF1330 family)
MNFRAIRLAAAGMAVALVTAGSVVFAQSQMAPGAAALPVYLIAHVQVTDPEVWKEYVAKLPATLEPFHVKTLARAPAVAIDASTPPSGSTVILAFNGMDDVKAFWNSPAYQAILPLREKSSKTILYAVPGVPPAH